MSRLPTCLLFAALACAPAAAQGGGFAAGDLYLFDPAVTGQSLIDGALVHVDLQGGVSSLLVDTFLTPQVQGAMVFDPWRQRVVFFGSATDPLDSARLWCVDAAGNLSDTGVADGLYGSLAPTGDGRIYMRDFTSATAPFVYLDAANALNVLMDDTGTQPFTLNVDPGFTVQGMIYDAGTNSLFVASNPDGACPGGAADKANVHKLPLSADGTRVAGPVGCTQFEVSTSGETPVGWSRGPAGQLVLVIDTNSNAQEPRLRLVDPVTLQTSVFALNGAYTGAAATNAGTWSSTLGKVVILDTFNDELRAFAAGEKGNGTVLAVTGPLSAPGGSGETASLVEIEPSACAGGWNAYGQGLAGNGAFVPRLVGSGCPQIAGSFSLLLDRVDGAASGLLFVGLAPASVPLKGGTFLVGAVATEFDVIVGGAAGVAGDGTLVLPATVPGDPALQGVSVFLQAGFHDAAAVHGVSLTQGLHIEIG